MLKEFVRESYNLAAELQELGCGENSIVGIVSENRLEYPIVILGAMLTGAIITCFNPDYTVGTYHVNNLYLLRIVTTYVSICMLY